MLDWKEDPPYIEEYAAEDLETIGIAADYPTSPPSAEFTEEHGQEYDTDVQTAKIAMTSGTPTAHAGTTASSKNRYTTSAPTCKPR